MTTKEQLNRLLAIIGELTSLYGELSGGLPDLRFVGAGASANSEVKKNADGKVLPFPTVNTYSKEVMTEKEENSNPAIVEFTEKEILKMPKSLRKYFRVGKIKGHVRRRENGIIEIRCQINKIRISGSGNTLERAKANFIKALTAAGFDEDYQKSLGLRGSMYFCEFADMWFLQVKKPTVKLNTYKSHLSTYRSHIRPFFEGKRLKNITPLQVQPLFNKLDEEGKTRTVELVRLLLNQIFEAAVGERLIGKNPLDSVKVLKYETKASEALSYEDERNLLAELRDTAYRLPFIIMLYTGVRRSELASMTVEDDFVQVKNAKIKRGQRVTFRKIPITPMLRPYLEEATDDELATAFTVDADVLSHNFKRVCPAHHLHELRHTFITRCQECGVPREVVSVWAGHAADRSMTTTVYTHFSETFMKEQAAKVDYNNRILL